MTMLKPAVIIAVMLAVSLVALAQTSPTGPQPSATSAIWYGRQGGEIRATKLVGTPVRNDAGEAIGNINEVLLEKDGRIVALVMGVGGFLGIGEREVAVVFAAFRANRDTYNNPVFSLTIGRDELKAAPEWKWGTSNRTANVW